jgi:hypothetical protein
MLRALLWSVALITLVVSGTTAHAQAPDVTGKWTASFETAIGVQEYTYDFAVKGTTLTGTMVSSLGSKSDVQEGRIQGTTVTFKETLTYMEMSIEVAYTGQIVSADEIKFSRAVGEFATEELVAKRSK